MKVKIMLIAFMILLSIPFLYFMISLDQKHRDKLNALEHIEKQDSIRTSINSYNVMNGNTIINEKYLMTIHFFGDKVYYHPELIDSIYKKPGSDTVYLFLSNGDVESSLLITSVWMKRKLELVTI